MAHDRKVGFHRRFQEASSRKKKASEAGNGEKEQKEVEEGDVCAICQDDMFEGSEPLTWCKQSCGQSVHAKCMKVWAEHKQSVGDKVTCPFCREDWGPLAIDKIKKEIKASRRNPNVHLGVKCGACHAGPVTGDRFRWS